MGRNKGLRVCLTLIFLKPEDKVWVHKVWKAAWKGDHNLFLKYSLYPYVLKFIHRWVCPWGDRAEAFKTWMLPGNEEEFVPDGCYYPQLQAVVGVDRIQMTAWNRGGWDAGGGWGQRDITSDVSWCCRCCSPASSHSVMHEQLARQASRSTVCMMEIVCALRMTAISKKFLQMWFSM